MVEKYRPSNGTEGEAFMSVWCQCCVKDSEASPCPIIFKAMTYNIDDDEYPDEWTYNDDGAPICTAFAEEEDAYRCPDTDDMFG